MYQALYRKWRPRVFDDVYGQEHITSILRSEIMTGKVSHAYLFCGPRGTGKTTCAKIISKAVNCENPQNGNPCGCCPSCIAIDNGTATDVIEMDAASNNGVDNIRDLRDGIAYSPSELKYRVFIVDEVHMLSTQAFNALLKTLEEPPKYVIFILATTELQKIPATVLSRCQRFDFHRVVPAALIKRMRDVCTGEGIEATDEALALIARLSQGSFRDALQMLEFCHNGQPEVTAESAARLLGASSSETLKSLALALAGGDSVRALDIIDDVYMSSRDITVFWREFISFARDMLIYIGTRGKRTVDETAASASAYFNAAVLMRVMDVFTNTESDMLKNPMAAKLYAEMAVIRLCEKELSTDTDALLARVTTLEDKLDAIAGGETTVRTVRQTDVPQREQTAKSDEKPTAAPIAPAEPDATAEQKPKRTVTGATRKKTPIRNWVDIVRRITEKEPLLQGFIAVSSAGLSDDGKLFIDFDNQMAARMLDIGTVKHSIAEIAGAALNIKFSDNDIIANYLGPDTIEARRPIDDLIDKSKELQNMGE
ncbi:MAG: DNA polymerase III subunit gamma/tau [Clostridia bacterium]|nr:DNA polymerase III subunit gamma/tau [Clostridia bacterium]